MISTDAQQTKDESDVVLDGWSQDDVSRLSRCLGVQQGPWLGGSTYYSSLLCKLNFQPDTWMIQSG